MSRFFPSTSSKKTTSSVSGVMQPFFSPKNNTEPTIQRDVRPYPLNGQVRNLTSRAITVWSDDHGCQILPTWKSSDFLDDVDFVKTPDGTWWKIGPCSVTVIGNMVIPTPGVLTYLSGYSPATGIACTLLVRRANAQELSHLPC